MTEESEITKKENIQFRPIIKHQTKKNQLQEETTPAVPLLLYDSENVYTVVLKFSTWGIGKAVLVIQKWIRLEFTSL